MERASSDNFMEAMHVRWASAGLTFSGPWSRKDLLQLQRVLTGLSSEELAFLKGTDFHRGGRDPGLSGNYAHSFASGQITYHDTAFRVGQIVGSPAKPHPDWILFHEIGHAISYGADRTAGVRAHEAQHRYDEVVQRATRPGALQDHAMQAELRDASQAVDHAREVVDLGSNLAHFGAGPGHHPAVSTYGKTESAIRTGSRPVRRSRSPGAAVLRIGMFAAMMATRAVDLPACHCPLRRRPFGLP